MSRIAAQPNLPPTAPPTDPARSQKNWHQPSRLWRALRFLLASSKDHAFLDRKWVSPLMKWLPADQRPRLALRLLSLSPHYWIYQWTHKYPPTMTRTQILTAEYDRNASSRDEICEKVLKPFLRPDMTVLDFGCGPGFLAKAASAHVDHVIATDVSRGVITCAGEINGADNLTYVANGVCDLKNIDDASLDLVYSFAVFQHLRKEQTRTFFQEFARALKPGGVGVLHTILKDPEEAGQFDPSGWVQQRVMLRMVYYSVDEMRSLLHDVGLTEVEVQDISTLADIKDDIGSEQLVTFRRKATAVRAAA